MVAAVRQECSALEEVVVLGEESWAMLLERAEEVSPERLTMVQAELEPTDPINMQYTSGTTGFPKGATLSHHNILNNGYLVGEVCRYTEEDRICIPVPFYHCFGMVMGNLAATIARGVHGHPGARVRPGADPGGGRRGALHLALRRADDVHRRVGPGRTSRPVRPHPCAPASWPGPRARRR